MEGNARAVSVAKHAAETGRCPVTMQGVLTDPESGSTLEDVIAIKTAFDKQKDVRCKSCIKHNRGTEWSAKNKLEK